MHVRQEVPVPAERDRIRGQFDAAAKLLFRERVIPVEVVADPSEHGPRPADLRIDPARFLGNPPRFSHRFRHRSLAEPREGHVRRGQSCPRARELRIELDRLLVITDSGLDLNASRVVTKPCPFERLPGRFFRRAAFVDERVIRPGAKADDQGR